MNAQLLSGVWVHGSCFPPEENFMWIDESRQRMIDFIVATDDPLRRVPMGAWLRTEPEGNIATTLRPDGPWTVHEIAFQDGSLHLKNAGGAHALRRLPPGEYPEWLESAVSIANAKMDEMEKRC
jgi:hypothetical protein